MPGKGHPSPVNEGPVVAIAVSEGASYLERHAPCLMLPTDPIVDTCTLHQPSQLRLLVLVAGVGSNGLDWDFSTIQKQCGERQVLSRPVSDPWHDIAKCSPTRG